jgi:hypothetical protein
MGLGDKGSVDQYLDPADLDLDLWDQDMVREDLDSDPEVRDMAREALDSDQADQGVDAAEVQDAVEEVQVWNLADQATVPLQRPEETCGMRGKRGKLVSIKHTDISSLRFSCP